MRFVWPTAAEPWHWALFGVVGTATVLAGLLAGFTFNPASLVPLLNPILLLLIAGYLDARGLWPRASALLVLLAWTAVVTTIMPHASYIATAADFPLCDSTLAYLDALLGIDVPGIARTTGKIEWLSQASAFAYSKTVYLLLLGYLVLLAKQDTARLKNTLSILLAGIMTTLALSSVLPAAGAFVHHRVADGDLGHLKGMQAGVWHLTHFEALRDGSMRIFPNKGWEGLVTFPSFHSIYALTGAYALAGSRLLAVPASLFAAAVIFSTIPVGGHHFVDVIAAIGIFAVAVGLVTGGARQFNLVGRASLSRQWRSILSLIGARGAPQA